jgi:hypothetical protein
MLDDLLDLVDRDRRHSRKDAGRPGVLRGLLRRLVNEDDDRPDDHRSRAHRGDNRHPDSERHRSRRRDEDFDLF